MQRTISPIQLGLYTLAATFGGFLVGNIIFLMLSIDFSNPQSPLDPTQLPPQRLRLGLFFSHFFTFAIPGLAILWWAHGRDWWQKVNPLPFPGRAAGWATLFALVSLPLVAFSAWANLQLPLPDWAMAAEEQTAAILERVMTFNEGPIGLALALLAIAFAAGVGEELIFRGILQGRVLGGLNHHLAIWVAATVFSLIHFELAGFLPRLLLGAVLGYVFHWSGSLLLAMVLHMLFNGSQVIAVYLSGEFTPDTAEVELPPWYILTVSLLLTLGIAYYLERGRNNND